MPKIRNFAIICLLVAAVCGRAQSNVYAFPPDGGHKLKIATLIPSDGGTYDHLHLVATLNPRWFATSNSYLDLVFGNREGFSYQYTRRGDGQEGLVKVAAYQQTDGSVDIYLCLGNNYVSGGYMILENEQDTAYSSPTDIGSATPSGTLVFDSSSSSYPAATALDFSGNMTVQGNLSLPGSGANITFSDNSVQSTAWTGTLTGGDYAESVDVTGKRDQYEPGDVLVVDPDHSGRFLKASERYSTAVTGVYSTKPGLVGRRQKVAKNLAVSEVPMAMVGIVPVKVTNENGPIKRGDMLVTSSRPGYAMRGTDRGLLAGAVIGKALEPMTTGSGMVEAVISLQ